MRDGGCFNIFGANRICEIFTSFHFHMTRGTDNRGTAAAATCVRIEHHDAGKTLAFHSPARILPRSESKQYGDVLLWYRGGGFDNTEMARSLMSFIYN